MNSDRIEGNWKEMKGKAKVGQTNRWRPRCNWRSTWRTSR